jgi:hypothetical protein
MMKSVPDRNDLLVPTKVETKVPTTDTTTDTVTDTRFPGGGSIA